MQRIFKDERRGFAPFAPNPEGTGPFSPPAASRNACVGPATRRIPLLTGGENGLRHGSNLTVNRP